ncbi:MAG: hypothetical protein JSR42_13375 [Proteobacteria bacterium]|nr:hypothetical protein [Pseudomonadota bacterium]
MKIDQLPPGARFQWRGRNYTKVGPMTAAADSGGVDFIPKHANLQPIPGEAPPAAPEEATAPPLDAARVKAAFEAYHRTALHVTDEAGRLTLESARVRFLAAIG